MKERYSRFWLIVGLLIILFCILLFRSKHDEPLSQSGDTNGVSRQSEPASESNALTTTTQSQTNGVAAPVFRKSTDDKETEAEVALWQSPIVYYGKVVDENGSPIPEVKVSYGANSLNAARQEVYNTGVVSTDARGMSKIDGVKGVNLFVQLSHPHYYLYPGNPTGFDKRSMPQKGFFSDTEEKAELFRMHSQGNPVSLVAHKGGFHAPNDGTVAKFPLRGVNQSEILDQLQIQGWTGLRSST